MKYISHRGNLNGRKIELENSPTQICKALALEYDVEIDVWLKGDQWYLGHDEPQYHIPKEFLINDKLWCHAKNYNALQGMLENNDIHCFWHQSDDRTLTSRGYVWTYIGKPLINNSIVVLPEDLTNPSLPDYIAGICSDQILKIKNNL